MTDLQSWVAPTCNGLADLLTTTAVDAWDAPSLCEKWLVRHVIAHVTMPARLTPEQFGAEMARPAATSPYFLTPWPRGTLRCPSPTSSTSSDPRNCTRGSRRAAVQPVHSAMPSFTPWM
jgi:Mycothiol maleylpyruvate isomerase N-terminal domain